MATQKNKPGWKTTEFWLTSLLLLGNTAMALEQTLQPKYVVIANTTAAIAYAMVRALQKKKDLP